jgi:hypothetical protein
LGYNATGKGSNTFYVGGTSSFQGSDSTTWATSSDARIKTNITPLATGISIINALNPVEFDYILKKNQDGTLKHDVSFIAQEYQTILPEQVLTHAASPEEKELTKSDSIFAIQQNLVPYLVKAVQELYSELNQLKQDFADYKQNHP